MYMFTLAICTYNRSSLLDLALGSLAACDSPSSAWELLLIDNNSHDATRTVAESYKGRLPLRYIFEPQQGLSAARNRGLHECRAEVLLFTDDDLRFDQNWLVDYERAFAQQRGAGWFGGRIRPLWQDRPPRWLRDENLALISGLLVHYDLGNDNRLYQPNDPTPFGASFAIRRHAFELVGKFRIDLGVQGDVPGRGEEADYFERLTLAGINGYYVGTSSAWHWQNPARFHWSYLYRYGVQKGIAIVRMNGSDVTLIGSYLYELEFGLKGAWQLLRCHGDRARQCLINMGIQKGMRHNIRDHIQRDTTSL